MQSLFLCHPYIPHSIIRTICFLLGMRLFVVNPRRACARVTVVVVCVCVCVCVCVRVRACVCVYPSVPALAASASVETSTHGVFLGSICVEFRKNLMA